MQIKVPPSLHKHKQRDINVWPSMSSHAYTHIDSSQDAVWYDINRGREFGSHPPCVCFTLQLCFKHTHTYRERDRNVTDRASVSTLSVTTSLCWAPLSPRSRHTPHSQRHPRLNRLLYQFHSQTQLQVVCGTFCCLLSQPKLSSLKDGHTVCYSKLAATLVVHFLSWPYSQEILILTQG